MENNSTSERKIISSTIKLTEKDGTFYCDTTSGFFSIYLPFPDNEGNHNITIEKINDNKNNITIRGIFQNNNDLILLQEGKIELICKQDEWVLS